jgi:hypothetical protein
MPADFSNERPHESKWIFGHETFNKIISHTTLVGDNDSLHCK